MDKTQKIVFQGEMGANSHLACTQVFPQAEVVPQHTFDGAFACLRDGTVDLAMIPVENNIAGRVSDVHRLLLNSKLYIVGEYFMRVRHALLGLRGATREGLTHVHSHQMALGQCAQFMAQEALQPMIAADTAGAAREVAALGDATQGAIAATLAAEIYGLDVLAEGIEDSDDNMTRFLIMSATPNDAPPDSPHVITSFIFRVRNVPAALYKALGGFATNGVNMTKLESYQLDGRFQATQFYADIEGHPDTKPVRLALDELAFFCSELSILGVYEAAPERHQMGDKA